MIAAKLRLLLLLIAVLLTAPDFPAQARQIVDMAGHTVSVPEKIRKVYGTSPPATYMVYVMDPGLVAGLNFPINPAESQYLDPRLMQKPVIGGWFGQGNVANLETLLKVNPDLILVWRLRKHSAINERIDTALKPLKIPVVHLVMETLGDYPKAFRFLGELFNLPERSRKICRYTENVLKETVRKRAEIEEGNQMSVYYAEGPDGKSTECHTSVHAEVITLSGGRNVHQCEDLSSFGMQKVSMEQVLAYDPQAIVSHDPFFIGSIRTDDRWRNIRAVKENKVYRIPSTPLNWFDRPPSFMRLLGVQWMMHRLYPKIYPKDLIGETRRFYRLFLNVDLDEATARKLISQ